MSESHLCYFVIVCFHNPEQIKYRQIIFLIFKQTLPEKNTSHQIMQYLSNFFVIPLCLSR